MDHRVKVLAPFGLNQIIKKLRAKAPDSVFRYSLPRVTLIVLTATTHLWHDVLGSRNPVFGGVLFLAAVAGTAATEAERAAIHVDIFVPVLRPRPLPSISQS